MMKKTDNKREFAEGTHEQLLERCEEYRKLYAEEYAR